MCFFLSAQINLDTLNLSNAPLQFISLLYLQRKGRVYLNKNLYMHIQIYAYIQREHVYGNIKYTHAQSHTYLAKERGKGMQTNVHI